MVAVDPVIPQPTDDIVFKRAQCRGTEKNLCGFDRRQLNVAIADQAQRGGIQQVIG